MALVDSVIAYEAGEMNDNQTLEFFAELVKNKLCWSLQGHYGRMASQLIKHGYLDRAGHIKKRF